MKSIIKKRINRSIGGDMGIFIFLLLVGGFMIIPFVYAVSSAFKPLDEIFLFPPRILVRKPTTMNFKNLFQLTTNLWVPFNRYLFNSVFISIATTAGSVFLSSLAAYPLAKHRFPGRKILFNIIIFALLFTGGVTSIPQYIIMAKMGIIDTYLALILPSLQSTMGLFLMKQFMEQIEDSILEAARIDGVGEFKIFINIVMPLVKPAWLTLTIFAFQGIWNNTGGNFIYSESLKLLPTVLGQIAAGGIARVGVGSAIAVLLMIPPILIFLLTQSSVLETMQHSGIK